MVDGNLSDSFEVKSGVVQDRIFSPFIFRLAIDYIIKKKAMRETGFGIYKRRSVKLANLDYTDDIVLITDNCKDKQKVLNCLV